MKKLIFILSLLIIGIGAQAQTTQTFTFTADTLTNADTTSLTSVLLNSDWAYSLQVVGDELTGTSTLTGLLQYSNDNTNWTTLSTADTLSLTADGSIWWEADSFKGKYLRAYVIQSGTATASVFGTLVIKRPVTVHK